MATGTAPNEPAPTPSAPTRAKPDPAAALIDDRLRRARRQVRGVELSAGLVTLALGTLAYLLVATVFDHWVITGGFGIFGRLLLFAVLLIAGGAYCAWRIAPPLTRSVNPIFAASVLERCRPTLKNGLVNLLFLRRETKRPGATAEDRLARGVFLGLQRRTADDLARMPAETHVVDRAHIVRLAALLAAVVIVCALYAVISPKSTMASFGRVILPWAPIDAPTRVTIKNVEPGDKIVLQGQTLTVWAEVDGLRRNESVLLYYTTADESSLNQAVPMTVAQGDYRYQCQLPPGQSGFQQNLRYYLAAGDYRTPEYAIRVETALTIVVDQVSYDYPDYTGLEDEAIRNVGDLRALEGSRVTLRARANRPIDWASLEMDCNSSRRRRMSVVDSTATASFELTMTSETPRRADHESYQIRFAESESGMQRENREPIRHRIEVIPDLPPEVRLAVEPADEMIELPLSGQLDIGVFAEDPDFALRGVTLRIEHEGRSLNVPPLLSRPRPQAAREGVVEGSLPLRPRDFRLEPGDVLTYWAEAKDNKQPLANRSQTERRQITIVADRGGESTNSEDGAGDTSPQPPPENPEETPPRPEEELTFDERENEEQPQESPPEWDKPESEAQENTEEDSDEPQEGESESGESGEGDQSEASEGGETGESQTSEGGESGETGESQASEGGESGETGESQASEGGESGEGGESSTSQGGQPGQRSRPIDPTNPGEAFEEMDEYFKEQERQEAQEEQPGQPSDSDDPNSDEPASAGDPSASQESEEGANTGSPESPGDSTSENISPPPEPGDAAEDQPNDAESGSSSDGGSDESAAPEDGEQPEEKGSASAASADQEGGAGAGTPSEDPQPTPAAQGPNQPDERSPSDSDPGEPNQDGSPPSPSISQEESDSEPRDSEPGDHSGAGDEGGGQDSDEEGQGTPGSSTPSEEGASQADESGQGEPGDVPGDDAESDHPTGNPDPDQRPGPGSSEGPSQATDPGETPQESGDPTAADAHSNTDSQTGAESNPDSPPLDPGQVDSMGGEPGDSGGQSQPRGAGPGTGPEARGPIDAGGPEGDAPDEDFARQTVDFVLEKLEDQLDQQEPDQELLDRLQWTREDLARFVDQWKAMKAAAERGASTGEAAREDLDEAIKSLGLRPSGGSVSRGGLQENATPNVDARRFDPPPRWSGFRELSRGSR